MSDAGTTAATNDKPPFHSFVFTSVDAAGVRMRFSMMQQDDGAYQLHIEHSRPTGDEVDFTRTVARTTAERLRDDIAAAGVYSWDPEYGDASGAPDLKWSLSIVFQKDVFTLESRGGSNTPAGFEDLMEALYSQDLPRPEPPEGGQAGFGASAAGPGAANPFAAMAGIDFASLFGTTPGGPDPQMLQQMQQALADMQSNPERFRQQMRDEFRSLPPDLQSQMIDMLASTGMASREWWERFFRG